MSDETPEQIESRLAHDRAALGETIDELQERLSPGELMDKAIGYLKSDDVKDGAKDMANKLVQIAKDNPLPLAVTGVGLAWLIASARSSSSSSAPAPASRPSAADYYPWAEDYAAGHEEWVTELYAEDEAALRRAQIAAGKVKREPQDDDGSFDARVTEAKASALSLQREAGEAADKFKARVDDHVRQTEANIADLRERAKSRARALRDEARSMGQQARAKADELGGRARDTYHRGREAIDEQTRLMRDRAERAQERTSELYHAEPLVAGAIGVVAGALLGALIPTSRVEDRYISEHAQRLRKGAVNMATDAAKRVEGAAAEAARAAADAAEEKARQQA
ncbi:MAG: DUF3618 domain-containing protein [Alphaproteobacteria bacterium]